MLLDLDENSMKEALWLAVENGRLPFVELLMRMGAISETHDFLHTAARRDSDLVLNNMLKRLVLPTII